MEAIGGNAGCVSSRAAVPGLSAAPMRSVHASGRPALAGTGTAVADTSSSDGGVAATPDLKAGVATITALNVSPC